MKNLEKQLKMKDKTIEVLLERLDILENDVIEKDLTIALFQAKLDLALEKVDKLKNKLEDKSSEIEQLKEQIKDIVQDRDDNYRPLTMLELVGIGGRW